MTSKGRVNAWISDPVGGLYYDPCEMTSGTMVLEYDGTRVQVKVSS